jgi:hypothetical protein
VTIALAGQGAWMGYGTVPGVGLIGALVPVMFTVPRTGTLSDLYVSIVGSSLNLGSSLVFTVYQAATGGVAPAATAVTATIAGGASSANDTVNSLPVVAGQLLGVFVTSTGLLPTANLALSAGFSIN